MNRPGPRHRRPAGNQRPDLPAGPPEDGGGAPEAPPMTSTVRILIADDHEVVRRGARVLLESRPGWTVCGEATDGREAVEKARRLAPDVVVLDIAMPELNGLEATRRIRQAAPHAEILILTMYDSHQVIREVLAAGARGYILKSDAGRELVSAVEALSQHKPFFTPRVSEMVLDGYLKAEDGTPLPSGPGSNLTQREREVIQMLAEGKTNKDAAAALGIGVKTVETHRNRLMRKLRLGSMSELVRFAIRNKIVEP